MFILKREPMARLPGTMILCTTDFMFQRQRHRGIGGTTKTQALRALEKRRSEVLSGDFGLVNKVGNPKIEEFAEVYLKRRQHLRSHKRDALSVRTLLKFFKGESLMSIKPANIEDYIGSRLKEGVSNATINRELACLKKMYNLAIKWGEAKRNPVTDVEFLEEPPGRTRFLSEEEAQRLIECSSEHLKPIVMTALNTGMRLGEILSLKWDQVHIKKVIEPYLEISETKNNKKRFVPLNDDMLELLQSLQHSGSEFVFLGTRGKRLTEIKKPFANALKRAGIEDFRFHDLRHTFASHYIMSGGDLLALKEILGHADLTMVQRYAHLASSHKRRQINNLSGKFAICHPIATAEKMAQNW